jgi:hypothetical protein
MPKIAESYRRIAPLVTGRIQHLRLRLPTSRLDQGRLNDIIRFKWIGGRFQIGPVHKVLDPLERFTPRLSPTPLLFYTALTATMIFCDKRAKGGWAVYARVALIHLGGLRALIAENHCSQSTRRKIKTTWSICNVPGKCNVKETYVIKEVALSITRWTGHRGDRIRDLTR